MKYIFKIVFRFILFCFLTAITQIGGIVYLLSLFFSKKWNRDFKFKTLIVFVVFYFFSTFLIVPFLAPFFGREKVKHSESIKPTSYFTDLLNRNYVNPKLNQLLKNTENELKGTNIKIHYLDANFPFINKFPLLPHLSHNDGNKIDLSLIYETKEGLISSKQKSMSGYGVFENPKSSEYNQVDKCLSIGYFQYDFPKYLTLGTVNEDLVFSKNGTKKLIEKLLKNRSLEKMFIEPHLKDRMNLKDKKIRYHGCRAVRHDDHIHIQIK
ncbi:hypothetical protein [Polaribacter sp. Asnod6-C07]|uniref:hypothetical protein n=1 Tax=Polaribacter sp. Asnod6-C07 TaxID=3160582 RepID=UPI003864BEDF